MLDASRFIIKRPPEGVAVRSVLPPWPQGEGAPQGASGVLLTATPSGGHSAHDGHKKVRIYGRKMLIQKTAIYRAIFLAEAAFSEKRPDIRVFFWPVLKTNGIFGNHTD